MRKIRTILALCAAATPLAAQGSPFQTPGMPPPGQPPADKPETGQADRFSSVFNPAFSFIVDVLADYLDPESSGEDDGFSLELRSFEFAANSWVDPKAWAYFIGAVEDESLNIEEAALHYVGFGGNHTVRAGRFFIDFGKQMQLHVHELRTIERPLALRALLGDEVKGDGAQWDCWKAVGDETVVRWSLGVFASLLPEELEFAPSDSAGDPLEAEIADRKDLEDLNYTARVTGFRDVGESGVLQLGASLRYVPDYTFVDGTDDLEEGGLSNHVWGTDVTYGWTGETGERRLTFGGEWLASTGDTAATVLDPDLTPGSGDETLQASDDLLMGWFAFGDYAWNRYNSAGIQFSSVELPDGAETDADELEVYYTRLFSEYHRLRFACTTSDLDDGSDRDVRFVIQYTGTLGSHGHGISF